MKNINADHVFQLLAGEAQTKKESQKRAAISVLKQLERVGILHVPNHYAEGASSQVLSSPLWTLSFCSKIYLILIWKSNYHSSLYTSYT